MARSSFELRKGIYSRLNTDLIIGIYSYVPQGNAFPFVYIAEVTSSNRDTKSTELQTYTVEIQTFTKNKASSKQLEELMTAVYSSLHNNQSNISVTGYSVVTCREVSADAFHRNEPDDRYWQGIQRFELIIESN